MNREIGQYLEALKAALGGADPATIQDALADAEEHLTLASQRETAGGDGRSFASIITEYGSPEEIAATYRELETRTPLPFSDTTPAGGGRPFWRRFFGVAADLRAYACLFYLFASLALGILYFTIAITGISLSLGLLVLIIGIPFVVGFLTAVRGIAVVEGRIEPREILNLTVMFDHNIIDGAPAARFTHRLVELIESGYGLDEG